MKILLGLALAAILTACGGIPLRSVPQLVSLQGKLLDAKPAEFVLAVQADARMTPKPDKVPVLRISIKPRDPGAFEEIDKALPMRLSILQTGLSGLETPPAGRRWFLYTFSPEAQAELSRIQAYFKRIRDEQKGKGGGTVSFSIAQEGVAATDPALADTRWESWLRVSREDGFFEIWSGTMADLLKQASKPG